MRFNDTASCSVIFVRAKMWPPGLAASFGSEFEEKSAKTRQFSSGTSCFEWIFRPRGTRRRCFDDCLGFKRTCAPEPQEAQLQEAVL